MVQRYGQSLDGERPAVDVLLGAGEYCRFGEILRTQAPEVDGQVYIDSSEVIKIEPRDCIQVKITQAQEYDLAGVIVSESVQENQLDS